MYFVIKAISSYEVAHFFHSPAFHFYKAKLLGLPELPINVHRILTIQSQNQMARARVRVQCAGHAIRKGYAGVSRLPLLGVSFNLSLVVAN